jgi:hypothetical protein
MNNCEGCKRRLPIHAGIHVAELEYILCTRPALELEAKYEDTWYRPDKKVSQDAPFSCGSKA